MQLAASRPPQSCIARARCPAHGANTSNISIFIFKGWYSEPNWLSQWPGSPSGWRCCILGAMPCSVHYVLKIVQKQSVRVVAVISNAAFNIFWFFFLHSTITCPPNILGSRWYSIYPLRQSVWFSQIVYFFEFYSTMPWLMTSSLGLGGSPLA